MSVFRLIIFLIYAFFIVFVALSERKNIKNLIIWELIVILFFIFGFLSYVIFGNRLKIKAKKQLLIKQKSTKNYLKITSWYSNYIKNNTNKLSLNQIKISKFALNKFNCNIWNNNKISLYTNGLDFLNALIKDLNNAKHSINIQFYIFANDNTGNTIKDILIKKAKQGIKINLLYDSIGSYKTSKKFWQQLKDAGINVYSFFPSVFSWWLINFKINYRNHRKIVVIDGEISYTGGVNLRDDHIGKNKRLKPWHDTHLKIVGNATYALQNVFLNDLCFCMNKNLTKQQIDLYFPKPLLKNGLPIQVVSSGPDKKYNQIEECYYKIINQAKSFLYIQTPYFVVEDSLLNAIISAKNRAVDVKIFIPNKPDKKLVYAGTILCLKKLIKNNVNVYLYNGFIHSKVIITESVLSVGTCNFDNRSFKLNFEDTCLIYNNKTIKSHKNKIEQEMQNSKYVTIKKYKKLSSHNILFKMFYKLLYKIL